MLTLKSKTQPTATLACSYSAGDLMRRMTMPQGENMVAYRNENLVYCVGAILAIEREDGSGRCFNVTIGMLGGGTRTIFHRCPC